MTQRNVMQSSLLGPIGQAHGTPVVRNDVVGSPVTALLLHVCPAAILGTVVAIIVDAIKCHSDWAFTHVLKKILDRLSPAFTDDNSARAVVLVCTGCWAVASCNHSYPRTVDRGLGQAVCSPFATTTHSLAAGKVSFGDDVRVSAIAQAFARSISQLSQAQQFTASRADQRLLLGCVHLDAVFAKQASTASCSRWLGEVAANNRFSASAVALAKPSVRSRNLAKVFLDDKATVSRADAIYKTRVSWKSHAPIVSETHIWTSV